MAREVHGPEYDPTTEDLDTEIVMRVGGGKKKGRYWIADGAIDSSSTPTLSQIRARSTSASPAIRPRQDTSRHQIQALEVIPSLSVVRWLLHTFSLHYCNIGVKTVQGRLEEETRKRQELEQRMSALLTYMHAATGVPPPATLFAQPPPPDPYSTPVSVASFPLHSERSRSPHIYSAKLYVVEFSLDLWPPELAVADLVGTCN
jgi:hypothetical protein